MILYSIIPAETVFGQHSETQGHTFMEIDYMGVKLLVSPANENNEYVIVRILSTSLKAFLDPGLQPGTVIRKRFS